MRDFVKRTLHRLPAAIPVGEDFFPRPPGGFDDVYNRKTVQAVEVFQRFNDITPTGQFGQHTLDAMWVYADAYSRWVYRLWAPPKPKPPATKLIEPRQGFQSLDSSLWELFSIGRGMGLSDLGTYNPASRLPSGAPSDHAVYPAFAFDLGIEPDIGWANETGRKFFGIAMQRPEVEYVILGTMIWSIDRGLHAYTGGGHENHVHVSGRR